MARRQRSKLEIAQEKLEIAEQAWEDTFNADQEDWIKARNVFYRAQTVVDNLTVADDAE